MACAGTNKVVRPFCRLLAEKISEANFKRVMTIPKGNPLNSVQT